MTRRIPPDPSHGKSVLFESGALSVETLTRDDAGLLLAWLTDEGVLEFYEGRDAGFDIDRINGKFYRDDGTTRCIVRCDGSPIGYLQFYPVQDPELTEYGFTPGDGRIFGMDLFIGDPASRNRGLGCSLVTAAVGYLLREKKADAIVLDPQERNARAIHVYEKAGFEKRRLLIEHERHEGTMRNCWLMVHRGIPQAVSRAESTREPTVASP
jgi:aminoglycoside 6'-N-acetyltransferase